MIWIVSSMILVTMFGRSGSTVQHEVRRSLGEETWSPQ